MNANHECGISAEVVGREEEGCPPRWLSFVMCGSNLPSGNGVLFHPGSDAPPPQSAALPLSPFPTGGQFKGQHFESEIVSRPSSNSRATDAPLSASDPGEYSEGLPATLI